MSNEKTATIFTKCDGCIFADYSVDGGQLVQSGCNFNDRLDKFIEKKQARKTDDGTYELCVPCNAYRDKQWEEAQEGDVYDIVTEQIKQQIHCIIVDTGDSKTKTYRDVTKSFNSCKRQTLQPINISVTIPYTQFSIKELYESCKHATPEGTIFKFIRHMQANISGPTCIDTAVQKTKSQYYVVLESGKSIPDNYLENLNAIINNELRYVTAVRPKPKTFSHGLVVQWIMHRLLRGNEASLTLDKIEQLAEEQNVTKQILDWDYVCNYNNS